jgi:hypothetical protein
LKSNFVKSNLDSCVRAARVVSLVATAAALIGGSGTALASNIVSDPGFESAAPGAASPSTVYFDSGTSIDGGIWNVTQGIVGVDTDNFYVFDGDKSLYLSGGLGESQSGPDSVSQTLTTVIGETYTIGFWADADVPNDFSVTFGGVAVTGAPTSITINGYPSSEPGGNAGEFVFYSGTATATSTSTDLVFTADGTPVPGSGVTVELDDVSVSPAATATPEPATLPLLGIGALILCARAARYRRQRA